MSVEVSAQPNAVALIREDESGELKALSAFGRGTTPFSGKARAGDLLEVRYAQGRAQAVRRLGRPSNVRAVIDALLLHAGEHQFSPEQEAAKTRVAAGSDVGRRDLRRLVTFTIDGEHTRDFDDAISARREGDKIRVWVHVADVAAYVRPGTELDREAFRRATSIYLPTATVPMLPRSLSNGACSLLPGEDRRAVTAEFVLHDGEVLRRRFYRSWIRSDARLTYDHVEDIFLGEAEPGPTYEAALQAARRAALDRAARESVYEREPSFIIEGDEVVGLTERPSQESQRLIERLMVLANQEVAHFLNERGVPSLYRIHAPADKDRIAAVAARLRAIGIRFKAATVEGLTEAVATHCERHGENPAIESLLWGLRSPAQYSREIAEHDGLGLSAYTHFTSPIRRYADLVVHRALLAEIGAEEIGNSHRYCELPQLAEHLNERNRTVRKLERQAEDICLLSLLRYRLRTGQLERNQLGRVTGISPHGCYVQVDCAEGLLPERSIGGAADESGSVWRSAGRKIAVGDQLPVYLKALDPVKGRVSLTLA